MTKDFYNVLGVNKSASGEEIKKAYRKQAMKYHPDRNEGDSKAEKQFKEINEAYGTLGDEKKKKNYDMFGSTTGATSAGTQGYSHGSAGADFSGFEDIFSGFGGNTSSAGESFDFSDLFGQGQGGFSNGKGRNTTQTKPENLDLEHTYEVPIFDILLGCSIEVSGGNKKKVKLKIPARTKPGMKFRVKGLGKVSTGRQGNLIVKIEAKMPKSISEVDKNLLEKIRENVGY